MDDTLKVDYSEQSTSLRISLDSLHISMDIYLEAIAAHETSDRVRILSSDAELATVVGANCGNGYDELIAADDDKKQL